MSTQKTKQVTIYAAASAAPRGTGGAAALLHYHNGQLHQRATRAASAATTTNRAQLAAVILGLRALKHPCAVVVFTASGYVTKVAGGCKVRQNSDLADQLRALLTVHQVELRSFDQVKATEVVERVQKMARDARESIRASA